LNEWRTIFVFTTGLVRLGWGRSAVRVFWLMNDCDWIFERCVRRIGVNMCWSPLMYNRCRTWPVLSVLPW